MVLGYGLYSGLLAKNGDQKLRERQLFAETKTLSTATQDGTDYEIPNLGDVAGLRISVTASAGGTLTTPAKLQAAVKEIQIRDSNGKVIAQNLAGSDLNFLGYLSSGKGKKITETDTSNSAATDIYIIPWSMDSTKLPARVRVTYNPYSSLAASGATSGSATVEIGVLYRDGSTDTTYRFQKQTQALVNGANDLSSKLPRDVLIAKMMLQCTEASLSDVTFTADGSEELKMKTADLIRFMESDRADARISNYLLVPVSPFISSSKSQLTINTSNTVSSSDLYIITMD